MRACFHLRKCLRLKQSFLPTQRTQRNGLNATDVVNATTAFVLAFWQLRQAYICCRPIFSVRRVSYTFLSDYFLKMVLHRKRVATLPCEIVSFGITELSLQLVFLGF